MQIKEKETMIQKILDFIKSIFSNNISQEINSEKRVIKNNVKKNKKSEINITNNLGDKNE